MSEVTGAVLVVGGGVAGIQAALDLAESGFKAYVVEKSPSIGGRMAQLDKTFPTMDCSICILSPKMVEVGRHPNINLLTLSEVVGLEGEPGNFEVTIRRKPRYVDESKCTGCGTCADACLLRDKISDEFDTGLGKRGAAYIHFLQAVPLKYAIDPEHCLYLTKGKCGKSPACKDACDADAIDFDQKPETLKLNVGSVIISTGYDPVIPDDLSEFGYDYDNVITAMEYERLMSASGPTSGEIIRLSDSEHARRVAFLQCVASRDCRTQEYCSAVCCTYATKEAVVSKDHDPDLDCHIFFMDMRTYGKGFEEFYQRAEGEYGVKYHRAKVADIGEAEDGSIMLRYDDPTTGDITEETYDLVVLCTGLKPNDSILDLAGALGAELDENNFIKTDPSNPLETSRKGVFVCGVAEQPKDIPESVAQASGAAGKASALLSDARGTLIQEQETPPEIDVSSQEPRIGIFVCHCGINIGGVVDVPGVVEYARTLPGVIYVTENLYTCSEDSQDVIKNAIKEHELNRIVVASCTPRTHEPMFRNTVREAGLNQYLFEMANIRDQCSWVHMHQPEEATEKAKDLVRMAVAKARLLEPLEKISISVESEALVIGGGVAGLTAALDIANQGFKTHIIEKQEELGGIARQLNSTTDREDPKKMLDELIKEVESNKNIAVYRSTTLEEVKGFIGNFEVKLKEKGDEQNLKVGAIIVATGSQELKPDEYGYMEHDNVVTLLDLEKKLSEGFKVPDDITFILCVGCRNDVRPYCSRYCCNSAIKNALLLKERNPDARIQVLHRDIRAYGEYERCYLDAIERGILFTRFDKAPETSIEGDKIRVQVHDALSDLRLKQDSDLLILATPLVSQEGSDNLSEMLKVPLNENGFFLEAHVKLRPVDFATDGIFLCGTCHSPKTIKESIIQASAAAARACTILSKEVLQAEGNVSHVNEELCKGCGVCVSICPYNAINIEEAVAHVNEVMCKGCGTCGATCINNAITMRHFTDDQIRAAIRSFVEEVA